MGVVYLRPFHNKCKMVTPRPHISRRCAVPANQLQEVEKVGGEGLQALHYFRQSYPAGRTPKTGQYHSPQAQRVSASTTQHVKHHCQLCLTKQISSEKDPIKSNLFVTYTRLADVNASVAKCLCF